MTIFFEQYIGHGEDVSIHHRFARSRGVFNGMDGVYLNRRSGRDPVFSIPEKMAWDTFRDGSSEPELVLQAHEIQMPGKIFRRIFHQCGKGTMVGHAQSMVVSKPKTHTTK